MHRPARFKRKQEGEEQQNNYQLPLLLLLLQLQLLLLRIPRIIPCTVRPVSIEWLLDLRGKWGRGGGWLRYIIEHRRVM